MFLNFFGKKGKEPASDQPDLVHDVDTTMNYCPRCGDEYRADIASCASCNVPLISGEEKLSQVLDQKEIRADRSMELSPDDELLTIRKGSVNDIKSLQKMLAADRIPSLIAGDENSCRKGCCGPELYLQVRKEDMDAVTQILTRDFISSTALDDYDLRNADAVFDQQADTTLCPACGCSFSPTIGACPECGLCFE
ncbi:MAG: hypothetical protein ACN4GW_15630 [Desulforhopalus sp.]